MADNLPPNKFLIKLGDKSNDVYFSDDTSSDSDEWVATNVVVDQGRVMQVWRHAKDGKKVVWVIIPVRGGFVVVKIWIKAKRKAYNVDMRKLRGRPDHAILTIIGKFNDDAKSEALVEKTGIKKTFSLIIDGEGGAKYAFSIVGSREDPPKEEDLSRLEEGYDHIAVTQTSIKSD